MIYLTEEQAQQIEEIVEHLLVGHPTARHHKACVEALSIIRAARAQADHIAGAGKVIGCAYCDNPLFAGTKCNNCGRVTLAEQAEQEPVAWTATRLWNRKDTWKCPADIEKDLLYAAPVQRFTSDDVKVAFENGYAAGVSVAGVAKEAAEQEPVGYWQGKFSQDGGAVLYEVPQASAFGYHYKNHAVYAAPVQQVTRADLKAAFKEGFERAADLYAPNDGQEQAEQEPVLAKHQPCGCIVCTCEDEVQCQGCGGWHCGTHPIGEFPNPIYAAPVRTKDLTEPLLNELRECRDLLMCLESCSRNNFENLAYERVQAIDAVIAADRSRNK